MLRRMPTAVYLSLVIAIGLIAVNLPALVFFVDKYEGTGKDFIDNGCLGDYIHPSSTLEDIATYADQLSVIRVASERFIERPASTDDSDGFRTTRVITISIEETLWNREGAPRVETEFEAVAFKKPVGDRKYITGDTLLEVGVRYLAPLTHFVNTNHDFLSGEKGRRWGPLTSCVVLPLDGQVIAMPEFVTYSQPVELAGRMVGMNVHDYAAILEGTSPVNTY